MTTLKIEQFGGMRPILEGRLLPDNFAQSCTNLTLRSGALQPLMEPPIVQNFLGVAIPKAIRLVINSGVTLWVPMTHRFGDVAKSPLINDAYERYYILDPPGTPMRYNTAARMLGSLPAYLLGIPAPIGMPTVTPSAVATQPIETRAYVYTFVDALGQEGPPSPAGLGSGETSSTWVIAGMDTTVVGAAQRAEPFTKRIYRTLVTSRGNVGFYLVAEVPLATASYNDTTTSDEIVQNDPMQSMSWLPPLDNMEGIAQMPGGFLVGWTDRTLHFSEPYRPWAWPPEYDIAVEYPIVGLAVVGQTLVIATRGTPYAAAGNIPAAMTPTKLDRFEPCMSRESIIAGDMGVYYASANGMIRVSQGSVDNITLAIITREEWQFRYASGILGGARSGAHLIVMQENGLGYILSIGNEREAITLLQDYDGVVCLWNDNASDEAFMMMNAGGSSTVLRAAPATGGIPQVYSWRSKEFVLSSPTNFAVALVQCAGEPLGSSAQGAAAGNDFGLLPIIEGGGSPPGTQVPIPAAEQHMRIGMSSIIGYTGINTAYINESVLAGTIPPGATGPGWFGFHRWPGLPGGGRDSDNDLVLPDGVSGVLRVRSNRVLVYDQVIRPNRQVRLPNGFRSDVWEVQVMARVPVFGIHLATHGRELRGV